MDYFKRFSVRKDTRLELKRKLEDKMFCKKKKKEDLISILILSSLLCIQYEVKKRRKEGEKITGNL